MATRLLRTKSTRAGPIRCPVIVGRDPELETVDEAVDAAVRGRGTLLVVSGEAGIGKSRLTAEAARRAQAKGLRVLRGRARHEGEAPYRPLAEAVQSAFRGRGPPDAAQLEPLRAWLGRLVPAWGGRPVREAEAPSVLPEAVLRLLRVLAAGRGLLLVIDDISWADPETLVVLAHLADHLHSDRLLCICTEQSDTPYGAVAARRAVSRIPLQPLSAEAVEEMARQALEVDSVSPALLVALRRARGVPFFVEEFLSAYVAAGGPAERRGDWWTSHRVAKALPPSYQDLVHSRLRTLVPRDRRMVAAGAVLGDAFDRQLIGPVAGADDSAVLEVLRSAVRAQLLTRGGERGAASFSFRHALAREAVLAELPLLERAELLTRAADAIEDAHRGLPGDLCERAAALRVRAGDRRGACRLLQECGRRALARGAPASAEAALERARGLAADDRAADLGAGELLIEALALQGKIQPLAELGKGLVTKFEGGSSDSRLIRSRIAQLCLNVARIALLRNDVAAASDYLSKAETFANDDILARLESTAARIALAEGDLKRARTTARSAASSAAQLQLVDVLCETLETQGRAALRSGDLDAALAAFEQMEELARTGGLTLQLIRALVELGTIDHLTRAQPGRLREAERLAVRKGAVFALARVDLELAWMHLGLAQLDEARRAVDHCLDSCRGFGLPLLGQALVAQTALHALGGRGAEMERAGSEALGAAVGDSEIEAAILGNGGAVLRIVLGEEDRALADLELALVALERAANRQPWWFHGLWTLLRSGGEDGRAARDALRDDPVLANPANRGYLAYADAHAAGADGRHVEAEAAFNGADALMPPGWRRHHARLVVGEKALAAGWGDPGAWAGEALAFAESTGMDWLAGRARAVMRQAGLRVPRRRRGRDRAPASAY